ncbi:winged helix-turn-helix domain-containing protein [Cohnella herbarum]|uniref:Helix-turn-helix transcriptional regulator n=1 Tax=Cohnella herbarum TaxID=2728023 RepID=A0A7Z2VQX6_9BACL|nr:helix-turn-helix domain-containing protein [Cohnella herbarum]QJD87509.1 helix-turn-helix transcriptional regulator [Cohnella herbarum]
MVVMVNPTFEAAYDAWITFHVKKSTGERKRKLLKGLGHAPKLFLKNVWWPLFGHLSDLIPEFEVRDFKDGYRYLDFAWIYNGVEIAIEIDGFGSHWRDIDRWQFDDHLFRQNDLVLDDWIVLRFSFDAIKDHPRRCQQMILHAKGKWSLETPDLPVVADPIDRSILEFAIRAGGPFSPSQAAEILGWNRVTIRRHAKNLAAMGILIPAGNSKQRNRMYKINPTFHSISQVASKPILRQR